MPLYKQGGSGLPQGGLPGQILGKTESGETIWVEPQGGLFRGEWGPDSLVYSYGFGSGLAPYVGSISAVSMSASRANLPVIVASTEPTSTNLPISTSAAKMSVLNVGPGYYSDLALTIADLGIENVTRVRFKHAATVSVTTFMRSGALVNGVSALEKGSATYGWEWGEVFATEADIVSWRAYTLGGQNGSGSNHYYVSDIQVYASDNPYMLGEFVTHQGRMFRSIIDNNASTPGDGAGWVEALTLPANAGTTAERPNPATAGSGFPYFDTTLNKPIWSSGTAWVDATGATV